jgi:hypothetical protein
VVSVRVVRLRARVPPLQEGQLGVFGRKRHLPQLGQPKDEPRGILPVVVRSVDTVWTAHLRRRDVKRTYQISIDY